MLTFDLDAGCAVLERTPSVLRALLAGLPDAWTTPNEGGATWSAFDVVGHLIDGEETDWMARTRIVLAQDGRTFTPYDRFRHLARNRGRTLASLLDEFEGLRRANLTALRGLTIGPRELALTSRHPELGVVTLAQLLATWVTHDLGHIAQIARVMAVQYRDAIGPWYAYIPVVQTRSSA